MSSARAASVGQYATIPDDGPLGPTCDYCQAELVADPCWYCHGVGRRKVWPAPYEPTSRNRHEIALWHVCLDCWGTGITWSCPNAPHDQGPDVPDETVRVTVSPLTCELCARVAVTTCDGCGMDLCGDDAERKGGLMLCPFCRGFGIPHDEGED